MDNEQFWKSVAEIIRDGFQADGLEKLNRYAEKFSKRTLVYKRYTPEEQYGCAAGGALNVIASLLAGAETPPDKFTAPEGSFKREMQRAEAQERLIEQWARASSCWFDNVECFFFSLFGEQLTEGGEAHVFDDGGYLVKYIGLDYFILPQLALDRVSLHNALFPETCMSVLGFGRTFDGAFQIVVRQPFIQGFRMSDDEIKDFALSIGFNLRNPVNWTYATPEIYLSDLHDENVIRSPQGNVFVLDCDVRINTPELRCGGARVLTNEVECF